MGSTIGGIQISEGWRLVVFEIRRIRTIAIETFKIVNKTSPFYLHDLITIKQSKYSFRYQNTASIPSTRTTRYGIETFKYFAAKTWNELLNHFRLENSFKQFKNLINSWNCSSCHCNAWVYLWCFWNLCFVFNNSYFLGC